jgi:RNA polymerase sigma-54 factor
MVFQGQTLQFRQSQNMVMTPQLQLSLKVLQLSSLELSEFIANEVEKNPLLELDENFERPEKQDEYSSEDFKNEESEINFDSNTDAPQQADSFDSINDSINTGDTNNATEALDTSDSEAWNGGEDDYYEGHEQGIKDYSSNLDIDDAGSIIEKTATDAITLREHLLDQITLDFESAIEKLIAANIVDMLDANGFLSSETLAEELENLSIQLNTDKKTIDAVLKKLKTLDPIGVFARNLKECLKIQLAEQDRLDETIDKYIDNLELAAKGEIAKLKKICNCDEAELAEIIKEIKQLNPRPAANFIHENVQTKITDIFLRREKDKNSENNFDSGGKWIIELNNEALPKVLLNKNYYKEVKKKTKDDAQKKYLSENYASANWLLRSLNQRAETTLRVATQLVEEQMDFFDKGINFLKPLKMRDIAEKLSIHESTVGRVVNGKFMATPRGVFELKYFFTSSVSSTPSGSFAGDRDDDVSSLTVKNYIKELVENENKSEILSDETIAEILQKRGINVARRTVAKYREAIGIPTSADRKRAARLNKVAG